MYSSWQGSQSCPMWNTGLHNSINFNAVCAMAAFGVGLRLALDHHSCHRCCSSFKVFSLAARCAEGCSQGQGRSRAGIQGSHKQGPCAHLSLRQTAIPAFPRPVIENTHNSRYRKQTLLKGSERWAWLAVCVLTVVYCCRSKRSIGRLRHGRKRRRRSGPRTASGRISSRQLLLVQNRFPTLQL